MWFILCPLISVCLHLVIKLSQQLFQGEADIVVIFLITVGNDRGQDARAHQANTHRQLPQNIDNLFMCLSDERDPIHLFRRHTLYIHLFQKHIFLLSVAELCFELFLKKTPHS